MEQPFKRQRLSGSSYPDTDLNARRARNDLRLKSIFESIFDKYGRDFDGIGDEIDMETGEIVVNNGHILGMTNERDAGDAEYSSEELGNTYDEDDHSSLEYSEDYFAALQPSSAGDAAVTEEPEDSEPSEFDADSLMGDAPAESPLHTLGKNSRRAVSIPPDDEEDELASSDIEWASYSKDRLGAQERWCLLNKKPAFVEEPAVEPAWRAPPLPNMSLPKREREEVRVANVDNLREYSDDERADISLWTPEVNKHPQRRRGSANSTSHQSMPSARGQENNADRLLSKLDKSKPLARKKIRWTKEEEELLVHLKTTTDLTNTAMVPYLPKRQFNSIATHWRRVKARGKASPKPRVPLIAGHRTPLPSLSPSMHSLASDETGPKPLEIEDDVSMRRDKSATNLPEQEIEVVSKNGYGAQVSSSTMSIKAEPDLEGAESYSDCIVSPGMQPRRVTAIEALNSPKQLRTCHSIIHQEESNSPTSEDIMRSKNSTAEGRQKVASTKFLSIRSAQPLNHGKSSVSNEPFVKVASKSTIKKQNVQVVIPMAATGNVIKKRGDTRQSPSNHPHITSPLATTETEESDFIRQLSAIPESAPTVLDLGFPHQEVLVIRAPTRSPSNAAAESQYAASAAFVFSDIRSSLGPEIADSQPLSTKAVVATPASDLGAEATRAISDAESQSLRMTPGVAPSARKQPKTATNSIVLDSDSQRLRMASEIATPAQKRIEEAIESDVIESGSHPPSKTLLAARSPSKKIKKEIIAESLSSIWTAMDDYSEDELSYL